MYMVVGGCPCDQPPVESLGTEAPAGALGRQEYSCVVTNSPREELSTPCELAEDGNFWKLVPSFLQILPQVYLSFADFALDLFTVMHLICRYDWTLGPVGPYTGSPDWGGSG